MHETIIWLDIHQIWSHDKWHGMFDDDYSRVCLKCCLPVSHGSSVCLHPPNPRHHVSHAVLMAPFLLADDINSLSCAVVMTQTWTLKWRTAWTGWNRGCPKIKAPPRPCRTRAARKAPGQYPITQGYGPWCITDEVWVSLSSQQHSVTMIKGSSFSSLMTLGTGRTVPQSHIRVCDQCL